MAIATDKLTYRIPLHKDKRGLRDIYGQPLNVPIETPIRFVVGVFENDTFVAAPSETNVVIKMHHITDTGALGAEIDSVSAAISSTTEAAWRAGTGHADLDFDGEAWHASGLAPAYAGGGRIRISLWLDSVMYVASVVRVTETGSSAVVDAGAIPTSWLQHDYDYEIADPGEELTNRTARWDGDYRSTTWTSAAPSSPVMVGGTDGAFSLSIWIYNRSPGTTTNAVACCGYVSGSNTNIQSFSIGVTTFNWITHALYLDSGTVTVNHTTGVSTNTWHHIVMWFDPTVGSDGTLYSRLDDTATISVALGAGRVRQTVNANSKFTLGGSRIHAVDGSIANANLLCVSHWNRALSGAEITSLYNSGTPIFYSDYEDGTGNNLLTSCNMFYGLTEQFGAEISDRTGTHPTLTTYLPQSVDTNGFSLPGGPAVSVSSWTDDGLAGDNLAGTISIDRDTSPFQLEFDASNDKAEATLTAPIAPPYSLALLVGLDGVNVGTLSVLERGAGNSLALSTDSNGGMIYNHAAANVNSGLLLEALPDLVLVGAVVNSSNELSLWANGGEIATGLATASDSISKLIVGDNAASSDKIAAKFPYVRIYSGALNEAQWAGLTTDAGLSGFAPYTILGEVFLGGTFQSGNYFTINGYSVKKPSGTTTCFELNIAGLLTSGVSYTFTGNATKNGSIISQTLELLVNGSTTTGGQIHFMNTGTSNGTHAISSTFTPTFTGGDTVVIRCTQDASTPPRNTYDSLVIAAT